MMTLARQFKIMMTLPRQLPMMMTLARQLKMIMTLLMMKLARQLHKRYEDETAMKAGLLAHGQARS